MPLTPSWGSCPATGGPTGSSPTFGSSVSALQVFVSGSAPPPPRGHLFSPAGPAVPVSAALRLGSSETPPPEVAQGHDNTVPITAKQITVPASARAASPQGFETEMKAGTVLSHLGVIFAPIGMDTTVARGDAAFSAKLSRHFGGSSHRWIAAQTSPCSDATSTGPPNL